MGMTFRADELSAMQSNAALLRASNSSCVSSNVGLPAALLMLERPAHSSISVIKFAFPSGMAYPSTAGLLNAQIRFLLTAFFGLVFIRNALNGSKSKSGALGGLHDPLHGALTRDAVERRKAELLAGQHRNHD
jgi:hypothetical protein